MITKTAAGMLGKAWHGAGAVAGTALGAGFPVYQYMSGEDSMGGAIGSALGMTAGGFMGKTMAAPVLEKLTAKAAPRLESGIASTVGAGKQGFIQGAKNLGKSLTKLRGWRGLGGLAAGTAIKGLGTLAGAVGTLGGGMLGFEAGRNIGNKYVPIHKRDAMPQVKQASAIGTAAKKTTEVLSPMWKKRLKWTGGIAGTGLAAYYGNKNFNETRDMLAAQQELMPQYVPMYPKQFYNTQQ